MSEDARTYRVRYDYDAPTRAWSALTDPDHGPASWGRTLDEARSNIRDAIASRLELPDEQTLEEAGITVIDEVRPPGIDAGAVAALQARRERAEELRTEVAAETARIAATLRERGLSMRDIGTVIGISHTRVAQLVGKG